MFIEYEDKILFYYPVTELWDKLLMHSAMVARTIKIAEGDSSDKYLITSDETTFFNKEVTKAITIAFEVVHKLSTGLTKGIFYNEKILVPTNVNESEEVVVPPSGGKGLVITQLSDFTNYGFYVVNLHGHYKHSLNVISNLIETFLIDSILKEWWLKCGMLDQYKVSVSDVQQHYAMLNNACYSLYKPLVEFPTSWTVNDVTIDEDGTETNTDTGETIIVTTPVQEVLYFDTFSEFPATGVVDIIYVDRSTNTMYDWSGTAYETYGGIEGEYEVNYVATDSLVVIHNLGKMQPNVTATDSDGNSFDVIWTPESVNQGTASWNTVGSGILRFN